MAFVGSQGGRSACGCSAQHASLEDLKNHSVVGIETGSGDQLLVVVSLSKGDQPIERPGITAEGLFPKAQEHGFLRGQFLPLAVAANLYRGIERGLHVGLEVAHTLRPALRITGLTGFELGLRGWFASADLVVALGAMTWPITGPTGFAHTCMSSFSFTAWH